MTVHVLYGGNRYQLHPDFDHYTARAALVRELNDAWFLRNSKAERTGPIDDLSRGFDPFVVFRLATGQDLSIYVHEAMEIAFEVIGDDPTRLDIGDLTGRAELEGGR